MRAKAKNEAFHLFLNGMTLAKVAEAVGVHRSTTERWSRDEHWKIRRQRAHNDAKEAIIKRYVKDRVHADVCVTEPIFEILMHAHAQHLAYAEGRIPRKALRYSARDLIQLCKALLHANAADRLNAVAAEVKIEGLDKLPG